jgi:aryl-alcohol dehydrogenase-like predicted oxidoreductase
MLTTRSGTPASRFSFGTMQFGGGADEAQSAEMYAACRTAGITFFDTAYVYTGGRSEEITGRLIAAERDEIFLATKCAAKGSGRQTMLDEFSESRRRLNQDSVDLLYLHQWDGATPLEESFEVLAGFVETGAVRHIGVSNFAAWQVMKAQAVAQSFGIRIEVLQPMYNLVKRQVEVEILPMAQSERLAVCPYSPLGGGLLTGKYAVSDESSGESSGSGRLLENKMYSSRYRPDWMHQAARDLAALGRELGTPAATLAVAWAARHPGVFGPIISARAPAQLGVSLDAMGFAMDDALYARISALSPRPAPATDRLEEA